MRGPTAARPLPEHDLVRTHSRSCSPGPRRHKAQRLPFAVTALRTDRPPSRGGEDTMALAVRELDASTWPACAELVERNGGIFGGCWCISWHPEAPTPGLDRQAVKRERVASDRAHAALVFDDDGLAQGWAEWGRPGELSNIKHRRHYDADPPPEPAPRTRLAHRLLLRRSATPRSGDRPSRAEGRTRPDRSTRRGLGRGDP
jgi:hypothetical protein